jgi:hypothetical protein
LTGKLINAWTKTPTKWYPLPLAVGALLLVVIQYRKKTKRSKEVHVDEDGMEVIKLKGPWQVSRRRANYDFLGQQRRLGAGSDGVMAVDFFESLELLCVFCDA